MIDWLNDWLTNLIIDWLTHWLVDSLIDSLIDLLIGWLIDYLLAWLVDSYRSGVGPCVGANIVYIIEAYPRRGEHEGWGKKGVARNLT